MSAKNRFLLNNSGNIWPFYKEFFVLKPWDIFDRFECHKSFKNKKNKTWDFSVNVLFCFLPRQWLRNNFDRYYPPKLPLSSATTGRIFKNWNMEVWNLLSFRNAAFSNTFLSLANTAGVQTIRITWNKIFWIISIAVIL